MHPLSFLLLNPAFMHAVMCYAVTNSILQKAMPTMLKSRSCYKVNKQNLKCTKRIQLPISVTRDCCSKYVLTQYVNVTHLYGF